MASSSTFIFIIVIAVAVWYFFIKKKQQLYSAASPSGGAQQQQQQEVKPPGQYVNPTKSSGSGPDEGWFEVGSTGQGHTHCKKGSSPTCVCLDTWKCTNLPVAKTTGYQPGKGQCRPDLSSYGTEFFPTDLCPGPLSVSGPSYGGPPGRVGGKATFYGTYQKLYGGGGYGASGGNCECLSKCDCTKCQNQTVASDCKGVDTVTHSECDCADASPNTCWETNACSTPSSTCDCTKCANTLISAGCQGVDSATGMPCACAFGGAIGIVGCWQHNMCPAGETSETLEKKGIKNPGAPGGGVNPATVRASTGSGPWVPFTGYSGGKSYAAKVVLANL